MKGERESNPILFTEEQVRLIERTFPVTEIVPDMSRDVIMQDAAIRKIVSFMRARLGHAVRPHVIRPS